MGNAGQALAGNLKRLRLERAISLSGLATLAGLSKATLSALEQGNGNPSVDTVWALAQALGVQFASLVEDDGEDILHVRRIEDAPVVSSEPGFLGRHLLSRSERGALELYVLDLSSGNTRKAAPHSPGVVEHVIVLSGKVDVGPNDAPMTLGPGDCMTFSADRPHHYRALGKSARLLSITDYPLRSQALTKPIVRSARPSPQPRTSVARLRRKSR